MYSKIGRLIEVSFAHVFTALIEINKSLIDRDFENSGDHECLPKFRFSKTAEWNMINKKYSFQRAEREVSIWGDLMIDPFTILMALYLIPFGIENDTSWH